MTLGVENFRNLVGPPLSFRRPVTLIYGDNAQGKTNLLEAIYFLGTTKSFRENRIESLVRAGHEGASVSARVMRHGVTHEVEVRVREGRKEFALDRSRVDVSDYLRVLPVVALSAEDRALVKGERKVRRAFLDGTACMVKPGHIKVLMQFGRALRQRNHLLKTSGGFRSPELEAWTETFRELSDRINRERMEAAEGIQAALTHLSGRREGAECLEIRYEPLRGETLRKALESANGEEMRRGFSLKGPHREEVDILLDGRDLSEYGSSGQLRSALWKMKLARVLLIGERDGELPVFLLDDVEAELDAGRVREMMRITEGRAQIFLTATRPLDGGWGKMERYRMNEGLAHPLAAEEYP